MNKPHDRDGAQTDRRAFLKHAAGVATLAATGLAARAAFAEDAALDALIGDTQRGEFGQGFDDASRTIHMPKASEPTVSTATAATTEKAIDRYAEIVARGGWPQVPSAGVLRLATAIQASRPCAPAWSPSATSTRTRSARSACSGRRRPCGSRCRPGPGPSRRTPASRTACGSPGCAGGDCLISWSIESPLAQPAGVSEPPWMLPGNSSMPVSRQPMPRMWLSPSPRTLSQTPCRISVRLLNGSSGLRLSLSWNYAPSSSGQNVEGITPFGLNMITSRCFRTALIREAQAGQVQDERDGRRADPQVADELAAVAASAGPCQCAPLVTTRLTRLATSATRRGTASGRRRHDLHHQLTDIITVRGECTTEVRQFLAAEGADRLLDQVMEQLLDERVVRLLAGGEERGQRGGAVELDPIAGAGLVGAGRVDRPALLPVSISADRVVVLQRKSQVVDHAVAGLARFGLGLELDALAGGQVRGGGRRPAGRRPPAAAAAAGPARSATGTPRDGSASSTPCRRSWTAGKGASGRRPARPAPGRPSGTARRAAGPRRRAAPAAR